MFEEYDFDTLEDEILSNVNDELDKREGSVIFDATAPAALMMANFYMALDMVLNETFADSASYYYLVKRAAERQLLPYEETFSVCKMVVTPTDVVVPVGERFNLDMLNYSVIGKIDDEQGAYRVKCETAGVIGNQQLGTLLPIEYVEGLESAELTEVIIPGEDEEEVEAFRERYFASFTNQTFGGNKADYVNKVTAIDGVGACKVIRVWEHGYTPESLIPDARVSSWIKKQSEDTVGGDVHAWLQRIYHAASNKLLTVGGTVKIVFLSSEYKIPSAALVKEVQSILDPEGNSGQGSGIAPIGHVVNVVAAESLPIDYSFTIEYTAGHSFADMKESIENAIDLYNVELCQSWAESDVTVIRISQLETRLLALVGIEDVTETQINGNVANLVLQTEQIPTRRAVNG